MSGSSPDDRQMDIVIGHILRIGVSVAAAVVFTGWIMYLGGARGAVADYRHFHGQPVSHYYGNRFDTPRSGRAR